MRGAVSRFQGEAAEQKESHAEADGGGHDDALDRLIKAQDEALKEGCWQAVTEERGKALPTDQERFILLAELSGGSTRGATCRFHVMIKGEKMDNFEVITDSDSFGIEASKIDICNDLIMFVGDSDEIIAVFPINETRDSINRITRFSNEKHKIQNKFKVSTEDLGASVYEASNVSIRNNIVTLTDDDNKILYIFPTKRLRYIMQEGKGEVLNRKY